MYGHTLPSFRFRVHSCDGAFTDGVRGGLGMKMG